MAAEGRLKELEEKLAAANSHNETLKAKLKAAEEKAHKFEGDLI
jgi:hypothetical protein